MTEDNCCQEFARAENLSRRRFLQGVTAAGAAGMTTSLFGDALRQTSFAATTGGNVLVVISLRGGIDGLGVVVPHGDPAYSAGRPRIAVPRQSLLAQDAMFGLHPRMKPLEWMFNQGELAAVHAVGMVRPNRSHFMAMEEVEDADPTSSVRRGWVNRMIGADSNASPTEAVHFTSPIVPTMLVGPAPTLSADRLERIVLAGSQGKWAGRRRKQLSTIWGPATGALGAAGRSALTTVDKVNPIVRTKYVPKFKYPTDWPATGLSNALKDTAQLIKANVGTEVVSIDYGSWDLHSDYGTLDYGQMQSKIGGFAASLNAFMRDLGPLRSRVTVVTISEFGRRVAENGNHGLDHGWGNMMLVAGGGVRGGRYYGNWPGLGPTKLVDGDLQVTTDYRDVLGEVVTRRFPGRSIAKVFPGLSHRPIGVMR